MAVVATCNLVGIVRNSDNSKMDVNVSGVVFGEDNENLSSGNEFSYSVTGLNPDSLAAGLKTSVESAVKNYLQGLEVSFGLLDTVRFISALV